MRAAKNLIYDKLILRPPNGRNVASARDIIKTYDPMDQTSIHEMEILDNYVNEPESILYRFGKIVVKFAQNDDQEAIELFNSEIIVGLEINRLNSDSFVRTIGYFVDDKCRIPNLSSAACTYLYVKEVPGPTLSKFLITASLSQFRAIMTKFLTAYALAVKELDFCHYDLHTDNVIITTVGNELVPVIIDFGAAHIRIPGSDLHIGQNWPNQGRYNDRSLWIYDIFKIFGFCWSACITPSKMDPITLQQFRGNYDMVLEIGNFCRKVLAYFHEDLRSHLLDVFEWTINPYWSASVTKEGEEASLEEFIAYYESLLA